MHVFSRSASVTRAAHLIVSILTAAFLIFLWLYADTSFADKRWSTLAIAVLGLLYAFGSKNNVYVDENEIIEKKFIKSRRIKWSDVDDLLLLPNTTVIKSSRTGKTISIFHPSPGNPFHQFAALKDDDKLRDLIVARSLPTLQHVWNKRDERREYPYPSSSVLGIIISLAPLSVPFLALFIFDPTMSSIGTEYLYLFLPFLLLSLYIAFRLGLLSTRRTLVISNAGVSFKNTRELVSWNDVDSVTEYPGAIGFGSIVLSCKHHPPIYVPKAINRFCDLVLQIRSRIGERCAIELNLRSSYAGELTSPSPPPS